MKYFKIEFFSLDLVAEPFLAFFEDLVGGVVVFGFTADADAAESDNSSFLISSGSSAKTSGSNPFGHVRISGFGSDLDSGESLELFGSDLDSGESLEVFSLDLDSGESLEQFGLDLDSGDISDPFSDNTLSVLQVLRINSCLRSSGRFFQTSGSYSGGQVEQAIGAEVDGTGLSSPGPGLTNRFAFVSLTIISTLDFLEESSSDDCLRFCALSSESS